MATETLRLEVDATLTDKMSPGIAGINTAITRLSNTASSAGASIKGGLGEAVDQLGPAFSRAGAAIPGLSGGISSVSSGLNALKANPVVAIATALIGATSAMAAFTIRNATNVHHLSILSQQTGITVSALNGLKKAGAESGLSIDMIAAATARMEMGLGKGSTALKKLGVDAKDPVGALAQIADKFSESDSQATRAAIGNAAFGRSWKEMTPLLQEGGQALRDAAQGGQMSQETIESYNKIHETMRQIGLVWTGIKKTLAEALAGPISSIMDSFLGTYRVVVGLGDGTNVVKDILNATAKDVGTLFELAGDLTLIVKGGLLMAFDTVAHSVLDTVASLAQVGVYVSKVIELTGHGKGMEAFFSNGVRGAKEMGEALDQSVAKQVQQIGDRLSGTGDRLRALWAPSTSTAEKPKKLSMGGDGTEKEKAESDKAAEDAAKKRIEEERKAAEQIRKLRLELGASEVQGEQDSRQKDRQLLLRAYAEKQEAYIGNSEALRLLHEKMNQDLSNIDEKWAKKAQDEEAKKERTYLKKFAEARRKESEEAQKELEKQEKAYDKTWGKIANTVASSATSIITTNGSMTHRMETAWQRLYTGIVNDAASWITQAATDFVKHQALQGATLAAEKAKSAAAAAESVAQAELTGTALSAAYATAATMASVATMGGAAVTGEAALTGAVATSKGLSGFAEGGVISGAAIVGEKRAEVYSPTVPGRITQTTNSTVNNVGGTTVHIHTSASAERVGAIITRGNRKQARGLMGSSH